LRREIADFISMTVTVLTNDPDSLLNEIKRQIKDGTIRTWSCDTDGDFTHTPEQWARKAYLRPSVQSGKLVLSIMEIDKTPGQVEEIYAVYHGRFIEMLLRHAGPMFTLASANPR
jgi:hypothetical protein